MTISNEALIASTTERLAKEVAHLREVTARQKEELIVLGRAQDHLQVAYNTLKERQQEVWSDGFAAGEQSDVDVATVVCTRGLNAAADLLEAEAQKEEKRAGASRRWSESSETEYNRAAEYRALATKIRELKP